MPRKGRGRDEGEHEVTTMIERVARAIDPAAFRRHESLRVHCISAGDSAVEARRTADWAHGHDLEEARKRAREAIRAMRGPTRKMIEVGHANISPWWSPAMRASKDYGNTRKAAESAFDGMIDQALKE